jgi:hypothetical protein
MQALAIQTAVWIILMMLLRKKFKSVIAYSLPFCALIQIATLLATVNKDSKEALVWAQQLT